MTFIWCGGVNNSQNNRQITYTPVNFKAEYIHNQFMNIENFLNPVNILIMIMNFHQPEMFYLRIVRCSIFFFDLSINLCLFSLCLTLFVLYIWSCRGSKTKMCYIFSTGKWLYSNFPPKIWAYINFNLWISWEDFFTFLLKLNFKGFQTF